LAKPEKIAPGLWGAIEAAPSSNPHLLHVASMRDSTTPEPRVVAFLNCGPGADLDDLASIGIEITRTGNPVRTARIPLSQLDALTDDARIKHISPARALRPLMDVAPGVIGVANVRAMVASGGRGKGVVIGIVDSGIDSAHAMFSGRIHRIWDHTLPGSGVNVGGFSAGYGRELQGTQLHLSNDTNGHGTHVAGIAAGNDPTHCGIAPEATIVMVKTTFQNTSIADGVEYVFAVADALDGGSPAVVNLSLGGHWDPHDGTDDLSLAIDNVIGPGKIVVCAAGNEGNDPIHGSQLVSGGGTVLMRFSVPPGGRFVALNVCYPGASRLEVALQDPSGLQTPFQPVISTGNFQSTASLPGTTVSVSTPGPNPLNSDHQIEVVLQGSTGASVAPGMWHLLLRHVFGPAAPVEAWIISDPDGAVFAGTSIRDSMKVGSPGCSGSAITVGSFTSKNQWQDSSGIGRTIGFPLNDITPFSSQGPLRSHSRPGGNAQREKPDVVAPGAVIASALSSLSSPKPNLVLNPTARIMFGTSMASPVVAGFVALLLEHNSSLTSAAAKAWLRQHAALPVGTAGPFHPQWGFGLLNVPTGPTLP
jgi:subtilisin family serine protease